MQLYEISKLAFSAVRGNALRSFLTMTIIAFGIMALVGILTSIEAIKNSLTSNFALMGTNTFNVIRKGTGLQRGGPGRRARVGQPIRYEQAVRFKEEYRFPALASVSALASTTEVLRAGAIETNANITLYGCDENYLKVAGYELETGRAFTSIEIEQGAQVLLIGSAILDKLFKGQPRAALNALVYIRNIPYRVIGILKEKGSSMSFSGDRMAFVPLASVRKYFGSQTESYNLSVMVEFIEQLDLAAGEAEGVFRGIRKISPDEESDFEIQKSDSFISIVLNETATIQLAAIFIGLITLLGAAIGLMNIMLVSVTERTREIGICKSLGATRRSILIQFLLEAILICQLGGIMGVLLGIGIGNALTFIVGGDFIIPWLWMALGLSLCFVVGLLSGFYPALKASALDPIEALRYE